MIKTLCLLSAVMFAVAAGNPHPYSVAASSSERAIVLRVTKADPGKSLDFTGWYQLESNVRILIRNRSAQFGIKLQTDLLCATFRKRSGDTDMRVEVIEFLGKDEIGSVSATGNLVEVDVQPIGDGVRMTVQPIEGPLLTFRKGGCGASF